MSSSTGLVLKWGIVSAGKISQDFATALQSLNPSHHIVQAVGARSLEDAKDFAKRFNVPSAYKSYDDLYQDPQVNIIYVGAINTAHKEICLKAINAGKHVLC